MEKWRQHRLALVADRLRALSGEDGFSHRCAIPDDVKEQVRIYVQSWILPHVLVLGGEIRRNSVDDLGDRDRF